MQPDDLARRILDRGFLSSKEVREAAGAPAPGPHQPSTPAPYSAALWPFLALGLAGAACVLGGILIARSVAEEPASSPRTSATRDATITIPSAPSVSTPVVPLDSRVHPETWETRAARARGLVEKAATISAGSELDRADEEARNAAAVCFQEAPWRPEAATLLWEAHAHIRRRLQALGAPALPQRVQALSTLREAMSQTLSRNPSDPSCKKLVAAASLELGDAVADAGQPEKAVELWDQAASLDVSLNPEVERRKAGR